MILRGRFPDTERAVVLWLERQVPRAKWYREFGSTQWKPPAGLVERTPGQNSGAEFEATTTIDVALFETSRPLLWSLVQDVEVAMRAMAGNADVSIDDVDQTGAFGMVPYTNTTVRRALGTFRITTRPE